MNREGDDLRIPVVAEEAFVTKHAVDTERVRINTGVEVTDERVRTTVVRDEVDIERVPVGRELSEVPSIREVDGVTIIPVLEERLVVEKRLFLVEELHVRRNRRSESVELPVTLRRTRVDIDRHDLSDQQEHV